MTQITSLFLAKLRTPLFSLILMLVLGTQWRAFAYKFDNESCYDMLPAIGRHLKVSPNATTKAMDPRLSIPIDRNKGGGEDDYEDEVKDPTGEPDLQLALEPAPYKITVNAAKYRRNRVMKVRVDSEDSHTFSGIFIQAKQHNSVAGLTPALIGSFVGVPDGISTLDCRYGSNFSVANTAYSNSRRKKKNVDLKWQAPQNDVGSIEFVATIISQGRYFSKVRSQPLLFNEFPPSLKECGKDQTCYRYVKVHEGCENGNCDFLAVAKVTGDDVIFTIGGRVKDGVDYVGIGLAPVGQQLYSSMDVAACVKTDANTVEAQHYVKGPDSSDLSRHSEGIDVLETDLDGEYIWCRFRRPLNGSASALVDLRRSLTLVFLWGKLDSAAKKPILPKNEDLVVPSVNWNHTHSLNFIHYVGGADIARISWTIVFSMLVATLIELYRI